MQPVKHFCSKCGGEYITGDSFTIEEDLYCEKCRKSSDDLLNKIIAEEIGYSHDDIC